MKIFLLSALVLTPQLWAATLLTSDPDRGAVTFVATANPSFLKVEGRGTGPSGQIQIEASSLSANLVFDLRTLKTGMDRRDDSMKNKLFQVDLYPSASLTISQLSLAEPFDPVKKNLKGGNWSGLLTLHGRPPQKVAGTWKALAQAAAYKIEARFDLALLDFGYEPPSFAGLRVENVVAVKVEAWMAESP